MNRLRVVTVTICTLLSMLDGFDVLVMAFTAPGVARDWALSGSQLGVLLSSALFGMAIGSLFLAPLADRYGRRAVVLLSLCLITAGLLLSAIARGMIELAALRGLTGLGVGGMLASLNVLTAEFASDRWRSSVISLQATGYPIGATLGGVIAAALISEFGWRSAFLFGGVCSAAMIPIVLFWLPESGDFLVGRGTQIALQKLNAQRRLLSLPPLDHPPASPGAIRPTRLLIGELLSSELRAATFLLWLAFFFLMFGVYFVLSWTPRLLVSAGLSEQGGITGGVLMNVGGVIGGAAFAWLAAHRGALSLTQLYIVGFAFLTALFGFVASMPLAAYATAWVLGIFLFGAMVGLYVLAPAIYPAAVRTTGMGWALGVGRLGAIVSPTVAGYFVDAGWHPSHLYFLFSISLLVAAGAVWGMRNSAPAAVSHQRSHVT